MWDRSFPNCALPIVKTVSQVHALIRPLVNDPPSIYYVLALEVSVTHA